MAIESAWFARAWQTEDGLPEHTIVGLEQTPDGYLWLATHRSLSRFDGVRFQEFTPMTPANPTTDQIRAMLLDRRGRLWLVKDGGAVFAVAAGKVSHVLTLAATSAGALAWAMAEDPQGNVWLGDGTGAVFRIHEGKVQTFGTNEGLAGQGICWLTADVNGQFWFSQAGRVGVFRDGRFVTLLTLGTQSARIAKASPGGLWICSGLKVFRYANDVGLVAVTEMKLEPGHTEAVVTALYEDRTHGLWIGTSSGGLFRYDSRGLQRVGTSHPNIINILEDTEGNVWVGTRGGGLDRLSPRVVQLLGPASGLPFAAVVSAGEDAAGTLWIAGQNGALAWRSNGIWSLGSSNSGWRGGAATCVAPQAGGEVLIGTQQHGVFRHQDGAFAPLKLNSQLANPYIRSLYTSSDGNLWVAINSSVIRQRWRDHSVKNFPLPAGVERSTSTSPVFFVRARN